MLSLAPTPVLLFISSSSAIYLRNQGLLQYQYQVLAPFVGLLVVAILLGLLLSALSRYARGFRALLWAYYLTGPLFLLFEFFRVLQGTLPGVELLYQTTTGLAVWPGLLLVAALALGRSRPSDQMTRAFAVFGMVLMVYEGGTLLYYILSHRAPTIPSLEALGPPPPAAQGRPNIYHLIFDAYQTDLLEHTLTDEAEKTLGGFTYFPNNRAEWEDTPMSLATIFSGRDYYYDRSSGQFIAGAFNSKGSLLYWLKSLEYQTVAYVPNGWKGRETYLDRVVRHDDAALSDVLPLNREAFWNLWLYSVTPAALRDTVMRNSWFSGLDETDVDLLQTGRLLPTTAPVTSYLGFERMLEEEKSLSSSGRYTLVHLIIPHYPLKLRSDCSYSVGSTRTKPLEQSQCALKLILKFVSLLKELGRFDDSLIVIHGDHGGPYRTQDGELVTLARSRSLDAVLLVKPVGTPAAGKLQVSDLETSLLMISGIIMSSVVDAESADVDLEPWVRRRAIVPRVEEEMVESAKLILNRHGFSLGDVTRVHDRRYPEGTVISQDPPAFGTGDAADHVSVVASLGPSPDDPSVMPNFVGRNVAEVVDWLQKRQLPTTSIHHMAHVIAPEDMVVTQSPRAGDRLDEDVEIAFYVSKGN
jgi:hypothetical protein